MTIMYTKVFKISYLYNFHSLIIIFQLFYLLCTKKKKKQSTSENIK